jgi:glycosyltransferase involved in cell wall biosynthesis
MEDISVVLATYNEEKHIYACLRSISDWAGEIIVVDGGSSDRTVAIAKQLGVKVFIENNPLMFHINKQKAIIKATEPWILQLDADERVSDELKKEISETIHQTNETQCQGYKIPRKNFFMGRWLSKGGQFPDYVVRLFQKGKGRLPCKSVHEQIEIIGPVGQLKNSLIHFTYDSVGEYWKKSDTYTNLTAEELFHQKIAISFFSFLVYLCIKPFCTFILIYVRHKGFVDGVPGFLFAFFSGLHYLIAFKKYLILRQRKKYT